MFLATSFSPSHSQALSHPCRHHHHCLRLHQPVPCTTEPCRFCFARACSCPVPPPSPALHSCRALATCALHGRYTVCTSTAATTSHLYRALSHCHFYHRRPFTAPSLPLPEPCTQPPVEPLPPLRAHLVP